MNSVTIEQVRAAKALAYTLFSKLVDVVGVGIAAHDSSGYALKINLKSLPLNLDKLPKEIDGVPVKIDVVGCIQKQDGENV